MGISDFIWMVMVEVYGIGIKIGDFIEIIVIVNVFYEKGVYIGFVKLNLGYVEGVFGLIGVIKSVLVFEYKVIFFNIKFDKLNLKSKIYVM